VLAPGVEARVDLAPWPTFDEPEAALASAPDSLARDFSADLARPNDVVYEPVGVRVRVLRVLAGGRIALVRGIAGDWRAYAPVERLIPEIPPGTRLRAAGGFAGFADLYPTLVGRDTEPVATGSPLVALDMGTATFDRNVADFVRVRVRVLGGAARGRTGWIPAAFTGIPATAAVEEETAAKACACRLVRFEGTK
jgi:hypothetical protein